jgi:hypothetical protein
MRLKPHAIDVRVDVDPVHWFLNDRDDTRSSYYLEDAATEFQVQGLELDWTCVTWDGDLRYPATDRIQRNQLETMGFSVEVRIDVQILRRSYEPRLHGLRDRRDGRHARSASTYGLITRSTRQMRA